LFAHFFARVIGYHDFPIERTRVKMAVIQFKIPGICFHNKRYIYPQIKIACFRKDKMPRLVQEKVSQESRKGCNSLQMDAVVEGTIN